MKKEIYKKIMYPSKQFFLALTVFFLAPTVAFAGSAEIFSSSSGGWSGMVDLNSYGVSEVSIDVNAGASGGSQQGNGRNYSGRAEAWIGSSSVIDDVPVGSDGMSVSARNTLTFNKGGSGNWLTGATNMGSTVSISGSAYVTGENADTSEGASGWVYWVDATVGTINVSSNIAGASYTITGPATLNGSGVSSSHANQPTGGYTITWNAVPGYTTPGSDTQTLTDGGTISFSGNYSLIVAPPVTINVSF